MPFMVFLWFLVFSVPTGMLMNKIGRRKTVILSLIVVAVIGLFFSYSSTAIFLFVALIGYGNSNIFPIMFSQALLHLPERNNEISGLMIMGLAGGAVFPLLMGVASDALNNQTGAVIVLTVCVAYLIFLSPKIKKDKFQKQNIQ
jgi:fucose permease